MNRNFNIIALFLVGVMTAKASIKVTGNQNNPGLMYKRVEDTRLSLGDWTFVTGIDAVNIFENVGVFQRTAIFLTQTKEYVNTTDTVLMDQMRLLQDKILQLNKQTINFEKIKGPYDIGNHEHGGKIEQDLEQEGINNLILLEELRKDKKEELYQFPYYKVVIENDIQEDVNRLTLRKKEFVSGLGLDSEEISDGKQGRVPSIDETTHVVNENIDLAERVIKVLESGEYALSTRTLRNALTFLQRHEGRALATPFESINQATLAEYGKMKVYVLRGQIILQVRIPLVTNTVYQTYELVPVPVFDPIELPINTAMQVVPAGRYLAIESTSNKHFFLTSEEREKCLGVGAVRICKNERQITKRADCESSLKVNPESYKAHSLCKRALLHGPEYYLIKTTNPSTWVYSTGRKINGTANCQGEQEIIFLEGTGEVKIPEKCYMQIGENFYYGGADQGDGEHEFFMPHVHLTAASTLWAEERGKMNNPVVRITNAGGQGVVATVMTIVVAVIGTLVCSIIYVGIKRLNEQNRGNEEPEAVYVPMRALDPTIRCEFHGPRGNPEKVYDVPRVPPIQVRENMLSVVVEEEDGEAGS